MYLKHARCGKWEVHGLEYFTCTFFEVVVLSFWETFYISEGNNGLIGPFSTLYENVISVSGYVI